ncbi:unnamed protein product [Adineta steineri]|uniref:ABC transmembrane type-1 domain-containing protein n=1 Tax=Adineta steineri TaxID=433720 RepID=A0A814JIF2_9BILA|nr:unnamed protein product [Adineta steineri]
MVHIQEKDIQNLSIEKSTEKIDKDEIKSVSLRSLFRYATWFCLILILILIIAAIANGISFPLLMLVFGYVINTFTDRSFELCSLNLTNISLQISFSNIVAERQTRIICQKLFRSIVHKEIVYFHMNKTGQLSLRSTDNVGDKLALATKFIASFISDFALISAVVFISTLTTSLTSTELKAYGKAGTIAEEALSSIRIVLSYNGQEREKKRFVKNISIYV